MAIRHHEALGYDAQRLAQGIASGEVEPFLGEYIYPREAQLGVDQAAARSGIDRDLLHELLTALGWSRPGFLPGDLRMLEGPNVIAAAGMPREAVLEGATGAPPGASAPPWRSECQSGVGPDDRGSSKAGVPSATIDVLALGAEAAIRFCRARLSGRSSPYWSAGPASMPCGGAATSICAPVWLITLALLGLRLLAPWSPPGFFELFAPAEQRLFAGHILNPT